MQNSGGEQGRENGPRAAVNCAGGARTVAGATWEPLVRRYAPYVHAVCRRSYGLAESDAEEVFQEVFMQAWTQLGELRGEEVVRPRIVELTHRVAASYRQARDAA
jgi:DNA-directed RNA polymerase specialized sigma24 family protein